MDHQAKLTELTVIRVRADSCKVGFGCEPNLAPREGLLTGPLSANMRTALCESKVAGEGGRKKWETGQWKTGARVL